MHTRPESIRVDISADLCFLNTPGGVWNNVFYNPSVTFKTTTKDDDIKSNHFLKSIIQPFYYFSPDFDLLKNFDPDRLHLRKSLSIMTSQFFNISNGIKWSADLYHNLFFYYSIQGSIDL